jgi:flagellar hook-associated protein 1 FlgK
VGIYRVDIGAETAPPQTLVNDSRSWELQGTVNAGTGFTDSLQIYDPVTSTAVAFNAGTNMGSLQSNIDVRDTYLTNLLGQFNDLAAGIIDAVNSLHQTTTLGTNLTNSFFDSSAANRTAAGIQLDTSIMTSANNIIAGEYNASIPEGSKGDGTIASKISSLASGWSALSAATLSALSTDVSAASSLGDYYNGAIIAVMGVDVQQAERMTASENVLVNQLSNQKDSVSGVSLDEEMTNLVKFQKSYAAAARMITIMDDMLDKIVNGMGVTR